MFFSEDVPLFQVSSFLLKIKKIGPLLPSGDTRTTQILIMKCGGQRVSPEFT